MADVNDIEKQGYWGDEFINEEMEQQKRKLETQKAEDDARIEQLSKGRQYWAGANMLANVFAQAVNSWGTANGAPAMQMPEYNNEYMKMWKESDEKRMASYQKMKDYYDRLRLMKVNRDQQLADREAGWQHQQDVIDENRQYEQGKKDEERQRKYDGIKAAYPKWSDNEIYAYIDTGVKPEWHVKKEKEEDEQRRIRIYQEQANARANAKSIYSGKGKEDENNIYIASEYGEPIMIPGKDKSSKKANIGLVGALVGEKLAQRFRKVEWSEISKATTDDEREALRRMKKDYDSFMAENKNTKWSSLSEEQINFYIRKYNLTDDADFMNSLHAMSDGSYNGVADAEKKAEGDGRQLPQLKNAFTLSRRPTISY